MHIHEFEHTLNEWGQAKVPFLFIVDFEMKKPWVKRLLDFSSNEVAFNINGITNVSANRVQRHSWELEKYPQEFFAYKKKFDLVHRHLTLGDSYLTNLTLKTEVKITVSLSDLFHLSRAKYKLLFNEQFLVFSPETFIQMRNGHVYSYPMKGTIDASLPDADNIILNDRKELAEHVTIVDLIRNDLSQIATNVNVKRFRYIDRITTNEKDLLQVSSEIEGTLPQTYHSQIGSLLVKLLPAGSVSGAPKTKTVEIIREAEGDERGYYTGIVGLFDGETLDSGVMIRYIEKNGDHLYYRSGGGITTQSLCELEFQEALDKVYVPVI
jgi:para-aminobenzoate synthetase component 1